MLAFLPGFVRNMVVSAVEAELSRITGAEVDALVAQLAAAAAAEVDKIAKSKLGIVKTFALARVKKALKV